MHQLACLRHLTAAFLWGRVTWELPEGTPQPALRQSRASTDPQMPSQPGTFAPGTRQLDPSSSRRSSFRQAADLQAPQHGNAPESADTRQLTPRRRSSRRSSSFGQPADMEALQHDDAGRQVTGQAEQELLSCLLVLPIGVQDPAMGGWCTLP